MEAIKIGHERRLATVVKQYAAYNKTDAPFRAPSLKRVTEPKKSVMELAAICNLPFRDGKVG